MHEGAQQLAREADARDELVEARVDLGVRDQAHRRAAKERQQLPARVGAHVRRKPIAPARRQPVDERLIAKIVTPAPVNPVRLEGVPTVGDEDHRPPAGPQHARDLAAGRAVVADVLQHLVAEDHVECAIGERQPLGSSGDQSPNALLVSYA
jgi:hypothetical protein